MNAPIPRSAGVLLHPTSLSGPFGVGDLGPEAYRFVDLLAEMAMTRWQILPLGPPGFGGSPYNAESSFAGNEWLISPALLVEDGLLQPSEVAHPPPFDPAHLDLERAPAYKEKLLRAAFDRFRERPVPSQFTAFCDAAALWLESFALYRALKRHHDDKPWATWEPPFRLHEPAALAATAHDLATEVQYHTFVQWLVDRQWAALRDYARQRGISIIGDIPMFPAFDSADVWANQHLFKLDDAGQPTVVAGVPPDYFSETGQLWGNPHYDWPRHASDGYAWWAARFRETFKRVDIVRIDHFRGFEAAWEVPAGAPNAIEGEWAPGPGATLFRELGLLSEPAVIAEDLGTITPGVHDLLEATGFPGMKVLQFAFGSGPDNPYLPHNHAPNAVVYTGTHDNDTLLGWLESLDTETRDDAARYLDASPARLHPALIRAALASVAHTAIIPMQDILVLGAEARMNTPSFATGSWTWRFNWGQLEAGRSAALRELVECYGRWTTP